MAGDDLYSWVTSPGGEEGKRLNEQHATYLRAFEYHVHPKIATALDKNSRIADVGTGTGIWLAELAQSLPKTCEFHGFDITDEQYPSKDKLPENLKLHVQDVLKPFPEHLRGQFDLVHIRLLITVLRKSRHWEQALHNVMQLLKPSSENGGPGGALQWTEINFMQFSTPLRGRRDGNVAGLTRSFATALKIYGDHDFTKFAELPYMFQEAGLRGVGVDIVSSDRIPEDRKEFTEQAVSVMPRIWEATRKLDMEGALSQEEAEELQKEMVDEVESGSYYRADLHTVIGCI